VASSEDATFGQDTFSGNPAPYGGSPLNYYAVYMNDSKFTARTAG
jgi:hypothetical protein